MTTIKIYYGSQTVDVDKLSGYSTFTKLHPEFQRRLTSMFHAANGSVGLGIGWRDPVGNDAEVRRREALRARGVRTAPMLYSNKTWHCAGGAADLTGDFDWVERNADKFGLWVFLPPEPWHVQPKEIPHSRPVGSDPSAWLGGAAPSLPTSVAPPPATTYDPQLGAFDPANGKYNIWPKKTDKPRIHSGSVGDAVKYCQGTVKSLGINPGPIDGVFGRKTNKAVRAAQRWNNLKPDGWVGPSTWKVIDIYALK